jgi:hypothetical protein
LTSNFLERRAVARALADQREGLGADAVDAAAGFEVRFEGFGRPARFEGLDQLGGADHFHAQAADQFDGAGVHHGHVGDGAQRRILHGHAPHARP